MLYLRRVGESALGGKLEAEMLAATHFVVCTADLLLEHDNNQLLAFGSDLVNGESEQSKIEEIRIEKASLVKNSKSGFFFLPPRTEFCNRK